MLKGPKHIAIIINIIVCTSHLGLLRKLLGWTSPVAHTHRTQTIQYLSYKQLGMHINRVHRTVSLLNERWRNGMDQPTFHPEKVWVGGGGPRLLTSSWFVCVCLFVCVFLPISIEGLHHSFPRNLMCYSIWEHTQHRKCSYPTSVRTAWRIHELSGLEWH